MGGLGEVRRWLLRVGVSPGRYPEALSGPRRASFPKSYPTVTPNENRRAVKLGVVL